MQPDDITTAQSFTAATVLGHPQPTDTRGEPISDIKKSRYKHRR